MIGPVAQAEIATLKATLQAARGVIEILNAKLRAYQRAADKHHMHK